MSKRKIGVYICYCGGNISDYVDCEKVRDAVAGEDGVAIAKTTMFTCSDAAQQEIIDDITTHPLDGIVVASCSPTLHMLTFRGVAERAGLNPYQYVQVNLREQCSWAHTDVPDLATDKAISMVRAGIAKARHTQPLEKIRVDTVPRALVVGAGITGLRAALGLSDLGISTFVVEKEDEVGGWVGQFGTMFPHNRVGRDLIAELVRDVEDRDNITVFTNAELVEKSGSIGDFDVVLDASGERISLNVGAVVVATGFDVYQPSEGEYGYGSDCVLTLPEFKKLVDDSTGPLEHHGKPVTSVAYVYCVGSCSEGGNGGHAYCSRYCCSAAMHTSLEAHERTPSLHQFHLFRDIRTYGKYESLFIRARKKGSVFIKFDASDLPQIDVTGDGCQVTVKDVLTSGKELEFTTDLVVLVTAMEPRENTKLTDVLKLPVGLDGFFMEIHPKLRPVETVIGGVFIAGTAQAPRNSLESAGSALAATVKGAALLKKGYVELEPSIATVDPDICVWCNECVDACLYGAIGKVEGAGKEVATVNETICKGCGACLPSCPTGALQLRGSTDDQIKATIEALGAALV